MEDVLAVYTRPRNCDCPLVCLDETSKQLVAEMRVPMPMKAGRPARFDYEYQCNKLCEPDLHVFGKLFEDRLFSRLDAWSPLCAFVPSKNHFIGCRLGAADKIDIGITVY